VNVDLEEESILLEKPRLTDLNMDNLNKELSVWDQIIVLSLIHHLQKTTPKDDLLGEQVTAYLRSIMDKSQNWLVYSMCLYVRSLNEFVRSKTKERSLLQLQSLIDQFNDKKPKAYERIKHYYSLYYPSFLELQKVNPVFFVLLLKSPLDNGRKVYGNWYDNEFIRIICQD